MKIYYRVQWLVIDFNNLSTEPVRPPGSTVDLTHFTSTVMMACVALIMAQLFTIDILLALWIATLWIGHGSYDVEENIVNVQ